MGFHHVSILLEPCLEALQIKPDGVYVDATTGGAGHSLRIAERLHDTGRLICIDRDDEALENAKDRLKDVWQRVTPVKSDFRDIDKVLEGRDLQVRTAFCSTSAFPLRSWIMLSAVFPICRMRRSICAWTGSRS